MSVDRSQRVESLFQDACDLDAEARDAFLRRECGADLELLVEVQSLLMHVDAAAPDFLEGDSADASSPVLDSMDIRATAEQSDIPSAFGRYKIIRRVGQGGMGTVYEAEQDNPRRRVALKVLRATFDRSNVLRRFEREAHLLGTLQHPAITHIYEAGVADTLSGGQPFIAMEFIDGVAINAWARDAGRSVTERLTIVADIADAVHHAHERGIVHRDLKPGNILVNTAGKPKILDFGIARVTDNDIQTVTLQTEVGQLMGTVPYMSPEQVLGDSSQIEATSDVYALGVLLFELLADRLPLDVRGRSIPEAVRLIQEQEPSRLATIDSRYRGDIDTIVLKALEKEKERRYQTAAELAEDIRRHLRDEPIHARPATTFYQLRKFAQRNKKLVGVVVFAFVGLLAATILTTTFAFSESKMRQRADAETAKANRAAYRSSLLAAQAAMGTHDVINARRILAAVDDRFKGGWEWKHLFSRLDASDCVLQGHEGPVQSVAFSPDGQTLLSASNDGTLRFWNLSTQSLERTLQAHNGKVSQAMYTPSGQQVVALGDDDCIRVWDAQSGVALNEMSVAVQISPTTGRRRFLQSFDVSPDGRFVAGLHSDQHVRIWDLASGRLLLTKNLRRTGSVVHSIAYTHGDQRDTIVVGWLKGLFRVCLTDNFEEPDLIDVSYHKGMADLLVRAIAVSRTSRRIATASSDKTIVIWNAESVAPLRRLRGHSAPVNAVAFDPTGRLLVSGATDETVRLWDVESGDLLAVCAGHTGGIRSVVFSPDGQWIVSGSKDQSIRLWRTDRVMQSGESTGGSPGVIQSYIYRGHRNYVYDVVFDPSDAKGRRVASVSWSGQIQFWDIDNGNTLRDFGITPKALHCIDVSASGKWAAVGTKRKMVLLLNALTGETERKFDMNRSPVISVAIDPSETIIAATHGVDHRREGKGVARVWNIESGDVVGMYDEKAWYFAAKSSNGLRLGVFGEEKGRIIDAATGRTLGSFDRSGERVHCLAFSRDDHRFAVGLDSGAVRIRDVDSGRLVATLVGHTERVYDAVFSPDLTRIATCSNDDTIRLWDAATFEQLLELRGHDQYVHALAFSPDGSRLVSASGDSTLRVWDTGARSNAAP